MYNGIYERRSALSCHTKPKGGAAVISLLSLQIRPGQVGDQVRKLVRARKKKLSKNRSPFMEGAPSLVAKLNEACALKGMLEVFSTFKCYDRK